MSTPREIWLLAVETREQAQRLEHVAIKDALEQAGWLVMRAARLLRPEAEGHKAAQWLAAMLRENGRHADLGQLAREHCETNGYTTGRPARSTSK